MSSVGTLRAEIGAVELLPDGAGFALVVVGAGGEPLRLELPPWSLHQLMRLLPRLDAALLQARDSITRELVAHPAVEWEVAPVGAAGQVAISVQTDQRVEAAYLFGRPDALELHAALGVALVAARRL